MQRLKNFAISIVILALVALPSTTSSQNQENSKEFSTRRTSPPETPQGSRRPQAKFKKVPDAIPNRYIVVLNDDVVSDDNPREVRLERVREIANSHALAHLGRVDHLYETALKGYSIELPNEAAAIAISRMPQVQWVEEDEYLQLAQTPASPQPSPAWGLDAIDGNIPAPTPDATGRTNGTYIFRGNGAGVNAYVLDSGINTAHVEFGPAPFASRATQAADCIRNNDCRNGPPSAFPDQFCGTGMPNTTNNDCMGHGTHVAGILGGNTYGVAKNVNIRSVKVCSLRMSEPVCPGSVVTKGIDWITSEHVTSSATPKLVSMSIFGATGTPPNAERDAMDFAVNNSINSGVTYVVAAGNANQDARNFYPADVTAALTVGAVDWNGNRTSFSNWGPAVDIFAPGVFVVSAQTGVGGSPFSDCAFWNGTNSAECRSSGTSQAAAHVAGAVAIYLQGRAGLSNCAAFSIDGPAPPSGNRSTCPDRVARFIKATANLNRLTNTINGTTTDPNGNQITVPSPNRFLWNIWAPTNANPIDNNQFFVWTQYVDFLNREPDPGGFQAWVNILNNCPPSGQDANGNWCDRIEVSAGFFRSPEFQARGYFIYRFYSTLGSIPLYPEFKSDFAKVSGFLTDQQLEANKVAFVNEFMARAEFQNRYGSTFNNPTAYVDALLQTVGLPNHPSRGFWINGLTNGSLTRAQVLRGLVDSSEVYFKYYNEAFVIMEYFGYLRRTADAAYVDWINVMNQTGGDYRVLINGFMNSGEYRRRFGPQ